MRIFAWLVMVFIALLTMQQSVLATNFLTPQIPNHGSYKDLDTNDSGKYRLLRGHVPSTIKSATKLSLVEGNKIVNLSIVLSLNNEFELDQRLLEIIDPRSPSYRQFLSQEQFMTRYAPSLEQVAAVKSFLAEHGITTTKVDGNRLILHAFGSVQAINRAFNTELAYFALENGKRFFAPSYELKVAPGLTINSVHGLYNHYKAHPQLAAKKTNSDTINPQQTIEGLTPSAIKSAYSLTSTLDGSGQTVALFELDGFDPSDITAYQTQFSLPAVTVTSVLVDSATGVPGTNAAQVTMDIELMMAMAPGLSQILVYQGPNTETGVIDTYNKIAVDNLAQSVSSSWTSHEASTPGSLISAEAVVFKQMAAQGQAMFAASGNTGAYNDGTNLDVEDPSSQPLVIAVGGTSLTTNTDGSYNSETAWFNSDTNQGGGGGVSSIWHAPTWQQSVVNGGGASYDYENVPDVSLNADPNNGYAIYTGGQWGVYGGTGAASSLWAGFMALVNQSLVSNDRAVLGFAAPFIFQAALDPNYTSYFHDISDNSTNGYYPAIEGFDLATGLGSFFGDALVNYFTTASPPVNTCVHASPLVIVIPQHQIGQPGDSLAYSIYIVNLDSTPCGVDTFDLTATLPTDFSATFDSASVTLQPNDSAIVTATITSSTTSAAQSYPFTIHAANPDDPLDSGSGAGVYQILPDRGPGVNLTITPQNGTIFYPSLYAFAIFQVILTDGQAGIGGQPTTITITGPDYYYEDTVSTQNDGSYMYYLLVDQGLALGSYSVTATADYQGTTYSAQTSFNVDLPFP